MKKTGLALFFIFLAFISFGKPLVIDNFEKTQEGAAPSADAWVFAAGQGENVPGSGKGNYCAITATVKAQENGNKFLELAVNVKGGSWPWTEGIVNFGKKKTMNFASKKYKGIRFKMKSEPGTGECGTITMMVMLTNPAVTDYSKYMKKIEPSADWVTVSIPFKGENGFAPTSWGNASTMKPKDYLSKISDIHFNMNQDKEEANTKGCAGAKWMLDDVELY